MHLAVVVCACKDGRTVSPLAPPTSFAGALPLLGDLLASLLRRSQTLDAILLFSRGYALDRFQCGRKQSPMQHFDGGLGVLCRRTSGL